MEHKLLLYGDNICESKSTMDHIQKYNEKNNIFKIKLEGSPALPIYTLKYKNIDFIVECRGRYENWDLPRKVSEYIEYFDKPDVVLYDPEKDKIIAAAEFTETVSVGNSQWQRSGRAVASAILEIPFLSVYPAVGEDRSQHKLREPTALLTEFFLKLSLDDPDNPTLLVLRDDPYVHSQNIKRKNQGLAELDRPDGNELIGKWFALRIIVSYDNSVSLQLKETEKEIYDYMFRTMYEVVNKDRSTDTSYRVEKDIPRWTTYFNNPTSIQNLKKHTLMDLSNTSWGGISGVIGCDSYFNTTFLNKLRSKYDLLTYVEGGKHCFLKSAHTRDVERLILEAYPPHRNHKWEEGTLDHELPTIFIPLQVWKMDGRGYSDPNAGEAAAFPAMYDLLDNEEITNIVYFAYGIPHTNWYDHFQSKRNKIWRAINRLGDILCVDNTNSKKFGPVSIKINRSTKPVQRLLEIKRS